MTVPLVSPTREALYSSTGHTPTVAFASEDEDACAPEDGGDIVGPASGVALGAAAVALVSHDVPADDLDVARDGFDGDLCSLEKVDGAGEDDGDEDVEADEKVALLAVPENV
ncbi:hypothetical protein ON010_g17091 [Phytophthora cinnamomi]|nr:hypothetical protein ON010_g17091 [Phytophthora cinnamomi]